MVSEKNTPQQLRHEPVLLDYTLKFLSPKLGESYLDLTAGFGGHASNIISRTEAPEKAVLVERDEMAVSALTFLTKKNVKLMHTDFVSAARQLNQEGNQFNLILADLGVSSPQFDLGERGFTFRFKGPLDMRMDQREGKTAGDLVNKLSQNELANLIYRYGEEPRSRKIARNMVEARPIEDTLALKAVITRSVGAKFAKDSCARTFQALRIAVNREIEMLEEMLQLLPEILAPGGRVAIISFHSLEDRLVKRFFKEQSSAGYEATLKLLTKKPILGNINNVNNPRARSAKLRAAVKIKTK
jgi:16S rRNA (cytosine1402-N4)-methyltransferase